MVERFVPKNVEELVEYLIESSCPDEELWQNIIEAADEFRKKIAELSHNEWGLNDDDVMILGSAARGTFLKNKFDIDIFLRFPPEQPQNLNIVVDKLSRLVNGIVNIKYIRKRFADHPYLEIVYKVESPIIPGGFVTFNLVPSYKTNFPNWMTPVDRTYYHHKYVSERIGGYRCDVTALKLFLNKVGVYGAEANIRGFSGYLCELLILEYGGFLNTLKAISRWRPPVVIDIENKYKDSDKVIEAFGSGPLIVVDPVDMGRNAASAVSLSSFSKVVSAAKHAIKKPYIVTCESTKPFPVNSILSGLTGLLLVFRHGSKIEEIHYPQMDRFARKLSNILNENGFNVYISGVYSNYSSKTVVILLLENTVISKYYLSKGPPPYLVDDEEFLVKNKWSSVWIGEDGRWYALKERKYTNVRDLILHYAIKHIRLPDDVDLDKVYTLPEDESNVKNDEEIMRWLHIFLKGDGHWRFLM